MDDSERSYGYSKDIYHGARGAGGHYPEHKDNEQSYEYGAEGDPGDALSPEEEAIHVVEGLNPPPGTEDTTGSYDYDRRGSSEVDSFTWNVDSPPETPTKDE
jgi:hypothetical protein